MKRQYLWEQWFGQRRAVLLRGVHYRCSQSSMCQAIRNEACRRRLRVRLTDGGTEVILEVVGAIPRTDTPAIAV